MIRGPGVPESSLKSVRISRNFSDPGGIKQAWSSVRNEDWHMGAHPGPGDHRAEPLLRPRGTLAANTKFTAMLTCGVTGAAGNPLQTTTWSFTTGP
jgi:hypothetical protein